MSTRRVSRAANMATVIELDELELVVVADNESDTLSSIDNAAQTSEAAGVLERFEPSYVIDGDAHTSVFDHLCCACHGFSVLATARRSGQEHTVLFDVGPYGDIWLANAHRLGINLAAIESIFLSHWHWDHSGGLVEAVKAIAAARRDAGLSSPRVDLHPDRPEQRGFQLPDGRMMLLPVDPTIDDIEAAGASVATYDVDHDVADGFFHGSGEIARITPFETGFAGHRTRRAATFEPDPLILDERFLSATVRGRGVTVLSACSHAGIINAATAAAQTANAPLDLVLGGYHLAGAAMEQRIPATVESLRRLNPKLVAPGHCTGWRAKSAFAEAFSTTGRYAPSVVGTRYRLAAS